MKKQYIIFGFVFAAALIIGVMIDQGKTNQPQPEARSSALASIALPTSLSIPQAAPPTAAVALSNPTSAAEPMKSMDAPTQPPSPPSGSNILFTDSFDHTYKPDWRRIDGDFTVIDNHFAATSGRPARVVVGSPEWKNYQVEGIFEHLVSWTRGYNNLTFGIRSTEEGNKGYFIKLERDKVQCLIKNQNTSPQVVGTKEIYLTNNDSYRFWITANNTQMTFSIDGEEVCTFADGSILSGMFYVEIDPGDSGIYPYIDDIQIRGI